MCKYQYIKYTQTEFLGNHLNEFKSSCECFHEELFMSAVTNPCFEFQYAQSLHFPNSTDVHLPAQ